jgi:hypothetical protein
MSSSDPRAPGATPADADRGGRAGETSTAPAQGAHDAAVARLLGLFFLAVTVPVLAGTWFASLAVDRVLNLAAAAVLGGIGALFLGWSRRLSRRGR